MRQRAIAAAVPLLAALELPLFNYDPAALCAVLALAVLTAQALCSFVRCRPLTLAIQAAAILTALLGTAMPAAAPACRYIYAACAAKVVMPYGSATVLFRGSPQTATTVRVAHVAVPLMVLAAVVSTTWGGTLAYGIVALVFIIAETILLFFSVDAYGTEVRDAIVRGPVAQPSFAEAQTQAGRAQRLPVEPPAHRGPRLRGRFFFAGPVDLARLVVAQGRRYMAKQAVEFAYLTVYAITDGVVLAATLSCASARYPRLTMPYIVLLVIAVAVFVLTGLLLLDAARSRITTRQAVYYCTMLQLLGLCVATFYGKYGFFAAVGRAMAIATFATALQVQVLHTHRQLASNIARAWAQSAQVAVCLVASSIAFAVVRLVGEAWLSLAAVLLCQVSVYVLLIWQRDSNDNRRHLTSQ